MAHLLEISAVSFQYPMGKRKVLDGCCLTVDEGDLVTILGPNGTGKSTLLDCCCGLLVPQSGSVLIGGKSIRDLEQREIARFVGYVRQYQPTSFSHTVFNYVLMGRANSVGLFHRPNEEDYRIAREAIRMLSLEHLAEEAVTEISGGERQKAAIARAVAQQPKVILFDEPTSHLDFGNQIHTLRLIGDLREGGYAIVMTTHNPDHCMMLGGRVAILNKSGRMESGSVDDVLTEEKLKSVYQTNLHLEYVESAERTACIPDGVGLRRDKPSVLD